MLPLDSISTAGMFGWRVVAASRVIDRAAAVVITVGRILLMGLETRL